MTPNDIELEVSPCNGKPQRAVIAFFGGKKHQDQLNVGSAVGRQQFFKRLSERTGLDAKHLLVALEDRLVELADGADAAAEADADAAVKGTAPGKTRQPVW